MNVFYMLLTNIPNNLKIKLHLIQQNINKFLIHLNYNHIVLTQKHLYSHLDKNLLRCHHLLSNRILHDIYFLTLMKNSNGFYLEHNIIFKNLPDVTDTDILLFFENDFPANKNILKVFAWSRKSHTFWDDCIALFVRRLDYLVNNKSFNSKYWTSIDHYLLSAENIMFTVWAEKYRFDPRIKILEYKAYNDLIITKNFFAFRVWY